MRMPAVDGRAVLVLFLLRLSLLSAGRACVPPENSLTPFHIRSDECGQVNFQLSFDVEQPVRFRLHAQNSTCESGRDLIFYIFFKHCLIAELKFWYTGLTYRTTLQQLRMFAYHSVHIFCLANMDTSWDHHEYTTHVDFVVNTTHLKMNDYETRILRRCAHYVTHHKGKAIVPITLEFSRSNCAVDMEFLEGKVLQPYLARMDRLLIRPHSVDAPSATTSSSTDKGLVPEHFLNSDVLAARHFRRDDDATVDSNSSTWLWKLLLAVLLLALVFIFATAYFVTDGFIHKPTISWIRSVPKFSFTNPNHDLATVPASLVNATPMSVLPSTSTPATQGFDNPVMFSSGGVHYSTRPPSEATSMRSAESTLSFDAA